MRKWLSGGADGNERLTAVAAIVLLLVLAAEGVTILRIGSLLTPHEFIGMLLIPPVALKLGSTGYRFASYYFRRGDYVEKGPPALLMRVVVAPVLVLATIGVFASGVALLALNQRHGTLVGIHKVSFIVWIGAFGIHVLAYLERLIRSLASEWGGRIPGRSLRLGLVALALAAGVLIAIMTMPSTDHWRDHNLPRQLDVD